MCARAQGTQGVQGHTTVHSPRQAAISAPATLAQHRATCVMAGQSSNADNSEMEWKQRVLCVHGRERGLPGGGGAAVSWKTARGHQAVCYAPSPCNCATCHRLQRCRLLPSHVHVPLPARTQNLAPQRRRHKVFDPTLLTPPTAMRPAWFPPLHCLFSPRFSRAPLSHFPLLRKEPRASSHVQQGVVSAQASGRHR